MAKGCVIWLTGLSGAGKTTVAEAIVNELALQGHLPEFLDGDVIRTHLSKGLGFSKEDRDENVRRVGWVAARVARVGGIVVVSLISPYRSARAEARAMAEAEGAEFIEVHVATPLDACIERDPKGLYQKAIAGEITGFTGIDDPYEEPEAPQILLDTSNESVSESSGRILSYLAEKGLLPRA